MKLTTKQIREIIKEELKAVLEGKYRTIYAPGPVPDDYADYKTSRHPGNTEFETRPVERGSHIEYHTDPFSELDPLIQQKVPRGEASQAYELQRALDPEFGQGEYPDFTGMSPEEIEVHKEKLWQRLCGKRTCKSTRRVGTTSKTDKERQENPT